MLPESFTPGEFDVICQRGKDSFEHCGNKRFRELIDRHLQSYLAAGSRQEKTKIVTNIFDYIRQQAIAPSSGFVKKDLLTRRWYQVNEKEARDKVGQALRDSIKIIRGSAKGKCVSASHDDKKRKDSAPCHMDIPSDVPSASGLMLNEEFSGTQLALMSMMPSSSSSTSSSNSNNGQQHKRRKTGELGEKSFRQTLNPTTMSNCTPAPFEVLGEEKMTIDPFLATVTRTSSSTMSCYNEEKGVPAFLSKQYLPSSSNTIASTFWLEHSRCFSQFDIVPDSSTPVTATSKSSSSADLFGDDFPLEFEPTPIQTISFPLVAPYADGVTSGVGGMGLSS
eukprot:Nitzschia sp. Nitz4//scaffold109_size72162//14578//15747//NITZ4_005836-RA/size72162-snap-gene-0.93-mRNA-1//1//CDS//3329532733//5913//frame0